MWWIKPQVWYMCNISHVMCSWCVCVCVCPTAGLAAGVWAAFGGGVSLLLVHTLTADIRLSQRERSVPLTRRPAAPWACGWGLKVTCVSCLRLRTRSRPRTDTHTTSANKHHCLTVFRWTGLGWQQVTSGNPYTPSYTIVPYHVAIETLLSIILQADTPACLWSGGNFTWVQKFVSLCFLYDKNVPQFYILWLKIIIYLNQKPLNWFF